MQRLNSSRIGRRSLLSGAALGLSSLALRPRSLWGAGRKLPPLAFTVVTDTHLGYRDQTRAAELWEKTAAEVENAPGDLVLHLGDVVDGGRESQYPVYLKSRRTITKPVHEIPGNHDPVEAFARHLRRDVDTVVEHRWLRFLLLNNARRDSHDGFLSEEQVEWIERQCVEAAKQNMWVALCMHVPAHKNLHPDRGWYVKPEHGQTDLYGVLTRHAARVVALLHGHFHNGVRGWDDHGSLQEICFPSALYNLDRKLPQQQAPGYNLPEFRPGFTQVRIERGVMTLGYRPIGVQTPGGGPSVERACDLTQLPA